jgi:hypothetical protein
VRLLTAIAYAYSVILVLTTPRWLLLSKVGRRIQVQLGDVVAFQACRQVQKVELDPANPDGCFAFMLWTDRLANGDTNLNKFDDFYTIVPVGWGR